MARGCVSIGTPSFYPYLLFLFSYLRPLPEPLRLLELELLVELPFDELLPLLRVLPLLLLPTRLLELPLVPLGRLLSFELFTLPLEEPVVPVRPLELLLVFGRVLVPLPVRPLDELVPLELWPEVEPVVDPLSTFGRRLFEPPLLPDTEPLFPEPVDEVPLL